MGTPISVPSRRVADAMISNPKTHGVEITVADAEKAFADAHVHLLLLVHGVELRGTLTRGDLVSHLHPRQPAIEVAVLEGRVIGPDEHVEAAVRRMARRGARRLAVTDVEHRLLGLLCLKRDLLGFCDESDVLARSRDPHSRW